MSVIKWAMVFNHLYLYFAFLSVIKKEGCEMTHSKFLKILLVVLVLSIALLAVILMPHNSYDWDAKVQDYTSTFNCELICLETYKDASSRATVYKFQTNDALKIEFEVRCFWGDTLLPFGFEIPLKKAKIVDDFAAQLCVYISETEGTYNIEDKSLEEISTYVLNTIQHSATLLQAYGVEDVTPNISFTFVKDDKSYMFKYGNLNETILYDKLTELLYN